MTCDRCRAFVSNTFRVIDVDGNDEWLCKPCLWDEHYVAAGGRIAQNPEDEHERN
jgi:hypothetical protein